MMNTDGSHGPIKCATRREVNSKGIPNLPFMLNDLINSELLYLDGLQSGISSRRDYINEIQ